MRKKLLTAFSVLALACVLFVVIGWLAPREHQGQLTQTLDIPKEAVWHTLTDLQQLPKRRPEVARVELLGVNDQGHKIWKEHTDMGGYILFEQLEEIPYQKLVVRMVESTFKMKGTWEYRLAADHTGASNKCTLTIKEVSQTDNLLLRSLMTLLGRDATMHEEVNSLVRSAQ